MNRAKQVKFYLDLLESLKSIEMSSLEDLSFFGPQYRDGEYYKAYIRAKVRLKKFKARAQRELNRVERRLHEG